MRKLLFAVAALAAAGFGFADTTDGPWVYLPRLTDDEQAIKASVSGHATGVITNGNWRFFVIANETKKTLVLTLRSDGWTPSGIAVRGAYIAGEGRLDLSLPIVSEDEQTSYTLTELKANCLRTGTCPTEVIFPTTITAVGNYVIYMNYGNLTNLVIDCPELTSCGAGIIYQASKLASLTLKCPKLKTIGSEVFYQCSTLSNWTVNLPSAVKYNSKCFYSTRLQGTNPEDFNLPNVTNLAEYAFAGHTGMTGDVLRLDKLQTIGQQALANATFDAVLLGYDNLAAVSQDATRRVFADTLVIGAGPQPVTLGWSAVTANQHHLWFRGGVPAFANESIQMEGTYLTTIFIRADEAGWADLPIREATGSEVSIFQQKNPGISVDRLIGILPQDTIGNVRDAFIAYGDYRTEESRLFVEVDSRYAAACPVTPTAGMHAAEFAAGETVTLTAPSEMVELGGIKVKATKYVVSELDHYGRWTKNVATNVYNAAETTTVTMPAKGSLKVEWIFEEVFAVKLAPRMSWYPEQVQMDGEDVPETVWVAKDGTFTFVARENSGAQPTTRFLRWEGDIGEADPTCATLTLAVTNPVNLRAVFAHDWYITNATVAANANVVITDGNWVLKARRMSDLDGRRRIQIGRSYDNTAIVSGEGPMDLSTRVTDCDGNDYYIHKLDYNAFRPGAYGNPAQNACTDFTAPTNLVELGQYIFYYANTALTNITLNCPDLTTTESGSFMGCSKIRRIYFNAPKLKRIPNGGFWAGYFCSCDAAVDVYLNLPQLTELPMKFLAHSPMTQTDCSKWHLESVTNILDWCMGKASAGPRGELRLPSLEAISGSQTFAERSGITKLVLGSGKLRLLGQQGGVGTEPSVQALCRPENALYNMTGLRHIELGLAQDAEIPDGVFKGLGLDKVTNLTFTAAPPSNTNIFAAVAKATTVPADGTKTVRVWANRDNPGWRDGSEFAATAEDLGILGYNDLTADEKAAYATLTGKEKKRWMGLVYDDKRFGWLFHYGDLPNGLLLLVK